MGWLQSTDPYADCTLCPRSCRVNRTARQRGVCGEGAGVRLARAALHYWEEPPISGSAGSGTVFFTGCPLRCVYCQNASIASGEVGREVSVERLAEIFCELQEKGALNINLVTPTHHAPAIARALCLARSAGLQLPVVYNTSGYESAEALRPLDGLVDVYLTDFKYSDATLAQNLSGAYDYPSVASAALDVMFEQVGAYTTGPDPRPSVTGEREEEMLLRGIVVRHLVLPGKLENSLGVLELLHAKPYRGDVALSLMSQYTPREGIERIDPDLAATVDEEDYLTVVDRALELGFDNSFMQVGDAAQESFIPDFDYEGI